MRITRTATLLFAGLALPATLTALPAMAQTTGSSMSSEHTVMVGGAPMYPSKNIVQNAVNSEGRRPGRHLGGPRPVHRFRADQ
jgi:hypothetical protein